jgi:DNA replication protein DnaC
MGSRPHCPPVTRKWRNRQLPDAFSATQEDSIRIDPTNGNESWRIPKYRHYVTGPTGIGKTWLACALAHKACRDGFFALHKRMAELFRDLVTARADGSIGQFLLKLARVDVLVLDDFAMAPLKDHERRDFLEICDDRYQRRSTILTSQLPVAHWHEQIGDPSLADSIMDRLVHNAYRIDLTGESMRKQRGRKTDQEPE